MPVFCCLGSFQMSLEYLCLWIGIFPLDKIHFITVLCLSRRFADTIERTCSICSWMEDEAFQDAIGDAVDAFLGEAPVADIY